MGWQQRDYARWTDEERRRFLGSGGSAPARAGSATGETRRFFRAGVGVAVAASAALFALGHFPRNHPLVPALNFAIPKIGPGSSSPARATADRDSVGRIRLPTRARVGGFLTIHGQLPTDEAGTVSVEGAFSRPPWRLLAAVASTSGSYRARIQLTRLGLLHLRVTYPDGHRAVGSMRVVR